MFVPDDPLTSLYRRYGPFLHARCMRMLGDRAAAEDATQETLLRVHRHLHRAPDDREALAWIYRIATNDRLDEIRNRKLRTVMLERPVPVGSSHDVEVVLVDRHARSARGPDRGWRSDRAADRRHRAGRAPGRPAGRPILAARGATRRTPARYRDRSGDPVANPP